MPLTRRQKDILTYLQGHIQQHGYAPSFEEIAEHYGLKSLATVHEHAVDPCSGMRCRDGGQIGYRAPEMRGIGEH